VSWGWFIHQWERSRAVKILMGFLIFFLVLYNLLMLSFIDMKRQTNPDLTNNALLKGVLLQLVRGIVTFQTEFYASGEGSGPIMLSFVGLSIFFLMFMVLIGSGLIADDISNNITDIYYSKLDRYEYIIGKFGAFVIFGNIVITLPFILEFFLLLVGIGSIDFISAFPVLIDVIIISELFIMTFASIILAFSAITNRRLYAGITAFSFIFITNMIIPPLAFAVEGEVNLVILLDILTVLLISSYIVEGNTELQYVFKREFYELNLASGEGIERWVVLGALSVYILLAFLIVTIMVYWRHAKQS
jgi:hypothetical protein